MYNCYENVLVVEKSFSFESLAFVVKPFTALPYVPWTNKFRIYERENRRKNNDAHVHYGQFRKVCCFVGKKIR